MCQNRDEIVIALKKLCTSVRIAPTICSASLTLRIFIGIATCPQPKKYLQELVFRRGNIEIIPYASERARFGSVAQAIARQKLAIEPDIFNILYVGRFNRRQGIETLIDAVSKPYTILNLKHDSIVFVGANSRSPLRLICSEHSLIGYYLHSIGNIRLTLISNNTHAVMALESSTQLIPILKSHWRLDFKPKIITQKLISFALQSFWIF